MPETKFLKCACGSCGGRIEFPAEGIDSTIPCPHCGWFTELTLELPELSPTGSTRSLKWIIAGGVILLVGALAAIAILISTRRAIEKSNARYTAHGIPRATKTNSAKAIAPGTAARRFTNDFSVSGVMIDKAPNSTLAYASGALKNESDRQRFGVTLEFELLDKTGAKIGTAKDYATLMEPRAEWKFRALLVQKNVVAARAVNVKEQE